jgi:hypothetical protein
MVNAKSYSELKTVENFLKSSFNECYNKNCHIICHFSSRISCLGELFAIWI